MLLKPVGREEELAGGPSPTHPEHLLPQEKLGDKLSRMDSGYSHRYYRRRWRRGGGEFVKCMKANAQLI